MRFLKRQPMHAMAVAMLLGMSAANAGSEAPPRAGAATPDTRTAIRSILPHDRKGREVCFEGSFTSRTLDMEDWAHVTTEAVPGVEVGGKPATRPVPRALPDQEVSRVALHLTYSDRQDDGAFDYAFTVMAASTGLRKNLFAHSGCAWSTKDDRLDCWIECDGGSMSVERIAGTESLDVSFSNLFMQAGCEGGGAYRIGTGEKADTERFRLEKVPLRVCKPLKAWARER
jgi:hypothetical protein